MCEAFHGPPFPGAEAAHINGNRGDDRPENLRWATKKENRDDKYRHGTQTFGERSGRAKITAATVCALLSERAKGRTCKAIAEEFGLNVWTVHQIVAGKRWKHITAPSLVAALSAPREYSGDPEQPEAGDL